MSVKINYVGCKNTVFKLCDLKYGDCFTFDRDDVETYMCVEPNVFLKDRYPTSVFYVDLSNGELVHSNPNDCCLRLDVEINVKLNE